MKLLALAIIPPALAVGGALLATRDNATVDVDHRSFHHTILWDSMSFDETVWLAVNEISEIRDSLPRQVDRYYVEVQSTDGETPAIYFTFDRASLVKLMAGDIAPEDFMQEYVKFN